MLTKSTRRGTGSQDLVDLLGECHERIRGFVALACEAGTRRDVPADQVAQACADVERYFREALPLHVADEEESMEPRLRGLSPELDHALDVMARQHREHARKLDALTRAANALRTDPHKESAGHVLAEAAKDLEAEFGQHLALEESLIFPAIRALLPHETQVLIVDELRRRRRHDTFAERKP